MQHWHQFWQKTGSILALLSIMVPLLYAIDFAIERGLHRLEMFQKMKHATLQTIVVDSATITWKKKGRELLLNNEYFDVANIRYEHGKAIIQGIFDDRETDMHESFANAQQQNKQNNSGPVKMVQWLMKHWLQPNRNVFVSSLVAIIQKEPISKMPHMHLLYASPPLLPPPQLLS